MTRVKQMMRCDDGRGSKAYLDKLLNESNPVSVPGGDVTVALVCQLRHVLLGFLSLLDANIFPRWSRLVPASFCWDVQTGQACVKEAVKSMALRRDPVAPGAVLVPRDELQALYDLAHVRDCAHFGCVGQLLLERDGEQAAEAAAGGAALPEETSVPFDDYCTLCLRVLLYQVVLPLMFGIDIQTPETRSSPSVRSPNDPAVPVVARALGEKWDSEVENGLRNVPLLLDIRRLTWWDEGPLTAQYAVKGDKRAKRQRGEGKEKKAKKSRRRNMHGRFTLAKLLVAWCQAGPRAPGADDECEPFSLSWLLASGQRKVSSFFHSATRNRAQVRVSENRRVIARTAAMVVAPRLLADEAAECRVVVVGGEWNVVAVVAPAACGGGAAAGALAVEEEMAGGGERMLRQRGSGLQAVVGEEVVAVAPPAPATAADAGGAATIGATGRSALALPATPPAEAELTSQPADLSSSMPAGYSHSHALQDDENSMEDDEDEEEDDGLEEEADGGDQDCIGCMELPPSDVSGAPSGDYHSSRAPPSTREPSEAMEPASDQAVLSILASQGSQLPWETDMQEGMVDEEDADAGKDAEPGQAAAAAGGLGRDGEGGLAARLQQLSVNDDQGSSVGCRRRRRSSTEIAGPPTNSPAWAYGFDDDSLGAAAGSSAGLATAPGGRAEPGSPKLGLPGPS